MKLLYFFFLLSFVVFCISPVEADTFYRETFNYCEKPTGRPSALRVAGWRASTTGNKEGKPSQLRIQAVGSRSRLPGVKSNTEGPIPGNIFWNRDEKTKGLLIYTNEFSFDIADLLKVTWVQKIDRQDKQLSNYGARLAFLIGGQWYISDAGLSQTKKNAFEKREFLARSTTYGIALPPAPGRGIAAPVSSGIALPAHATVTGFGLFFNNAYARVRIDDFALVNSLPLGSTAPDVGYPRCRYPKFNPNTAPDDSNPTGGDVEPPAPKPQCQNGFDDDGDGLVDLSDPGCKSVDDNFETGGVPPEAPIDLKASDGTSDDFVRITWAPAAGATSYRLYRSQVSPAGGDVIAQGIAGPEHKDHSAVPGVTYYYWVTALNQTEDESAQSNADQGYRKSPVADTDGDGVPDGQEDEDGTDPKDPGSFQLHLKSPAFTKYNTYLGQWNFLELTSSGSKTIHAKVDVLSLGGATVNTQSLDIAAQTEIDLDINSLLAAGCAANPAACQGSSDIDKNGLPDTYGLARIEFNDNASDPGAALLGRMSNYRPNADGTFSFAFAKELRNPAHGITFAGANTFDPQGQGFLVPNWLELSNLDNVPRDFDYILWTQNGAVAKKYSVQVPAFGERDIQAGHEFLDQNKKVKEGVYLAEVRPKDGATSYFATVSRYSSNSVGAVSETYNFAFSLDAVSGTGSQQLALISNLVGQCSTQTNWFEVVNVRDVPVLASVRFRARSGTTVGASDVTLAPKSQFHFNASALLEKNSEGSVSVSGNVPGSLLGQSLVYLHDCRSNTVQTAYALQARIPSQDVQQGSVNTYLGMKNEMYFISAIPTLSSVEATLNTFDPGLGAQNATLSLDGLALNSQVLAASGVFSIPADRYGSLVLKGQAPSNFTAGVLRIRTGPDGVVDFVMPTNIQ